MLMIQFNIYTVKHYNKNKNYAETCRIFECKRTSLTRWVDKYNETGSVKNKSRELISYKVTNKHMDFIKSCLSSIVLLFYYIKK
jgi:transposase